MPMEDFFEAMCVMDWITHPDGGGGFVWDWKEGAPFDGGIVLNTATQMQIAQQTGTKSVYTLTTAVHMPFEKGDVVKRLRDDALFKITSDPTDLKTPLISDIKGCQVSMERVTV